MTWDGKPRRAEDSPESVATRLALLEKFQSDSEQWHRDNKESHDELAYSFEQGINTVLAKMEADKKEIKPCLDVIATNSNSIAWMKGWCGGLTTALAGIVAYLGGKH